MYLICGHNEYSHGTNNRNLMVVHTTSCNLHTRDDWFPVHDTPNKIAHTPELVLSNLYLLFCAVHLLTYSMHIYVYNNKIYHFYLFISRWENAKAPDQDKFQFGQTTQSQVHYFEIASFSSHNFRPLQWRVMATVPLWRSFAEISATQQLRINMEQICYNK